MPLRRRQGICGRAILKRSRLQADSMSCCWLPMYIASIRGDVAPRRIASVKELCYARGVLRPIGHAGHIVQADARLVISPADGILRFRGMLALLRQCLIPRRRHTLRQ